MNDLVNFNQNATMTLKEITDLLEVRHNNAMRTVAEMAQDPSFGGVTQIEYRTSQGNSYQTYALDKRQSIAVASRLNTALCMRVIDRWLELETAVATLRERTLMKAEYKSLTDLIKENVEQPKPYHYSNEARMVRKIVGIQDGVERDEFSLAQIEAVRKLEALDKSLIELGMDYQERKERLEEFYIARLVPKLIAKCN